jgi:hypothetical protein
MLDRLLNWANRRDNEVPDSPARLGNAVDAPTAVNSGSDVAHSLGLSDGFPAAARWASARPAYAGAQE